MPTSSDFRVEVHSRSDGRYAETPLAFRIGERAFRVERVLARRRTPESEEFVVASADGEVYRLVHLLAEDVWQLGALPLSMMRLEGRARRGGGLIQQQNHPKIPEEDFP